MGEDYPESQPAHVSSVNGTSIWRSVALVAGGLAIGLAGAWAATRVLKNFLFEVSPFDPLTVAAVSLWLALVALLACYIPARRAAATDPLVALRYE